MRRIANIRVNVGPVGGWSSVRSDYDHRLRLSDSRPRLRLVEVNTSFVAGHDSTRSGHKYSDSTRSEYEPCRESPSCRRTYTPSPSHEDSSEMDIGESTSTRSGDKLVALPELCTKHYQREYDVEIAI
jgi:hypothetical protein